MKFEDIKIGMRFYDNRGYKESKLGEMTVVTKGKGSKGIQLIYFKTESSGFITFHSLEKLNEALDRGQFKKLVDINKNV